MSTTAIVLCGSITPCAPAILGRLPAADVVIAADAGLHHAAALALDVDVIVGDMDSVDAVHLDDARARGTRVELHPIDKDATDLDLALDTALALGTGRIVVVDGGVGPRVDHFLANALLLTQAKLAGVAVEAAIGDAWLTVVRPGTPRSLHGEAGSLVSLLATGGVARGVTTTGLRWALRGDDLETGSTRGVSNTLSGDEATVSIVEGVLLAVQPLGGCR
jgi:thiamine pyrophosphokinase